MGLIREYSRDVYNRKFSECLCFIENEWVYVHHCERNDSDSMVLAVYTKDGHMLCTDTDPDYVLFETGYYVYKDTLYCVVRAFVNGNYRVGVKLHHTHYVYKLTSDFTWYSLTSTKSLIGFMNGAEKLSESNQPKGVKYLSDLWILLNESALYYTTIKIGTLKDGQYIGYRNLPVDVLSKL